VTHITAIDRDAATRTASLAAGTADHAVPTLADAPPAPDDLLVLATPVRTILDTLAHLPVVVPNGCLVLDLGSTKSDICRAMEALPPRFAAIGGHPMCGREVSGFEAGSAELYRDQTFVLTPNARTTASLREAALTLLHNIGAQPLVMVPAEHDQSVALVSHLPYTLAALLMQHAYRSVRGEDHIWRISASGFRDTARLAGSDPNMMRDIMLTNRRPLLTQLRHFRRGLDEFITFLEQADETALFDWLADRQGNHAYYRQHKENGAS
jgi:prephenate dehydrogenase